MKSLLATLLMVTGLALAEPTSPFGVVRAKVGNMKDNAYAVALQADGRIITVGASYNGTDSDAAVVRYLADGTVDRTFAEGGALVIDSDKGDDKAYAVAIWEGKIYVAGQIHNGKDSDFAVWRLLSSGKVDKSFGVRGLARMDFGKGNDTAYAITVQNDGRVLVGGVATSTRDKDFGLARFLDNGAPDVGFGYNGKLVTALGDKDNRLGNETGYSLLQQQDGKIVIVGFSEVGQTSVMAVVRYLNDGRLDTSFGDSGYVTPYFGRRFDRAYTAAIDGNGRIVMGGMTSDGRRSDFALVRITPQGRLDRYFGQGGMASTSFTGTQDTIYGIGFNEDGSIVAAGSTMVGATQHIALARFTASGVLDPRFGEGGKTVLPGEGPFGAAYGVLVQPDGKIIAAGVTSNGDGYQIALARYEAQGGLDTGFGIADNGAQSAHGLARPAAATAEAGFGGLFGQ